MSEWITQREAAHQTGIGQVTLNRLANFGLVLTIRVPDHRARGGTAIKYAASSVADLKRDPLLTPKPAAARLGVRPNTLTEWTRLGDVPHIRVPLGRRNGMLYRRSDIDRLATLLGKRRQDQPITMRA